MNSHSAERKSDSKELEKTISPVLVVNNSKLKPFIELFENYPENIMLQGLGTMFGFFKINDKSEDSAYIVNFLSSVIKKEYYINHKRPVSESFDSALHKVNLALSEIAKNGNIRWIGQLDAAICVLEKNILHFTVCGSAKILLLRNQMMNDIGHDLNPEELEPNPIKTFSNVSSGYLENGDKIIVTSNELFNIFSLNELKKGALRFDQEKFVQFLKTAMVNELDSASTIVVDLNEAQVKKEAKKSKPKEAEQEINPFDSKTFEKPKLSPQAVSSIIQNNPSDSEYTDEKTGHIYVQGEAGEPTTSTFWTNLGASLEEKMGDFSYWTKTVLKKLRLLFKRLGLWIKEKLVLAKIYLARKAKERQSQREEISQYREKMIEPEKKIIPQEIVRASREPNKLLIAIKAFFGQWKKLMPAFSKIKSSFLKLNYHQRLYALLTLLIIVTAPILFLKLRSASEEPAISEPTTPQISQRDIILQDKNIREVSPSPSSINDSGIKRVIFLNDLAIALSPAEINVLNNDGGTEKFPLPDDFGSFALATPMEDLNLIFLLSDDGRLISWSPIAKKFQANTLALPENQKIEAMGTYLTYLYLIDSLNNQIYRYPRSTGGFGEKADWLKETMSLSGISDMAIEENIFLSQNNQITKLFQGKKQAFNPDPTAVPLVINKIFTGQDISNLYVLDSQNGRVVKFTKDGLLLNQYYSEKLLDASDFAVDEKNSKVFFANSEGLSSFSM